MNSITDFFTPSSVNESGNVPMLSQEQTPKKSLYIVNQHGIKLLKIALNNEKVGPGGNELFAQLKIIRYGFKRALLWEDRPTDPKSLQLRDDVELTYHGSKTDEQSSKIHLKAHTQYQTLLDNALDLPIDGIEQPAPLFSFELDGF